MGRTIAGAALVCLGTSPRAGAQERTTPPPPSGLVRGWSDAQSALERPTNAEEQLRAVARLGSAGDQRSLDALVRAAVAHLSEGRASKAAQLPAAERGRLRIALAHALSHYTDHLEARRALARLMTGALGSADARDLLAAGISATALARAGTPDALETLGRALAQSKPLSDVARAALLAHPPRDLRPLLRGGPLSLAHVELFGELGDQRAFMPLREVVRTGAEPLRGPAALALLRLGALETQPYARHAFRHSRVPSERLAALEILVVTGDELASQALSAVLSGKDALSTLVPDAERVVVELAARAPRKEWQAHLLTRAKSEDEVVREQAFLALARLGGPADFFARALSGKDAPWAAQALAESSARSLDPVLIEALSGRTSRAWALRALSVRLARGASESARVAFDRATNDAKASSPSDRAAAAWGTALVHPARASTFLQGADEAARRAVLRQAFQGTLALTAAERLRKLAPTDAEHFSALSPCLLDAAARRELSTQLLSALPRRGSAVVPAVAGAIAERSPMAPPLPEAAKARDEDVRRWLGSADPELRAAAARGLGASADSASVGVLSELYLFEPDARVRRALVRTLAKRPERSRLRTLELARTLDPDAAVRTLATLTEEPLEAISDGLPTLTWLVATEGPVRLSTAWGESMVVFPDPDGFVGVLDFGPGPIDAAPVARSEPPVAKPRSARDASPDQRVP